MKYLFEEILHTILGYSFLFVEAFVQLSIFAAIVASLTYLVGNVLLLYV